MVSFLPESHPRLGTVELDEVLEWYDAPVLFIVRNDLGYLYLCVALENEAYLYIPASPDRIVSVKTGLIAVDEAFRAPEQASGFYIQADRSVVEVHTPFPGDWLPAPDLYLSVPVQTALSFSTERLSEMARRQGRRLTALKLDPTLETMRTEFPVREMSDVLGEFQELTTVLNLDHARGRSEDARMALELDAELAFVQVAAASFVVILSPRRQESRLFAAPNPAVARLLSLFEATEQSDGTLAIAIREYGKRTVAHLRDFLTVLSDIGTGVTIFDAEPSGQTRSTSVSQDRARLGAAALRATEQLPSATLAVVGHLVAIDTTLRIKTFKVRESRPPSGKKKRKVYRGTIDPSVIPNLDGVTVGESTTYRLRLSADSQVSTLDEETVSLSYRLLAIEDANARL